MKNNLYRRSALVMSILLLIALAFPTAALAAGKIDTEQSAELTVHFKDGATPIPNAHFMVYKVADRDEYGELTLSSAFESFKGTVTGLADLNTLPQDQWLTLAATLKGYLLNDSFAPDAQGNTDSEGKVTFSNLKAGLFLVLGDSTTVDDGYIYTPIPFFVFLPAEDSASNEWNYSVTAVPKYEKELIPDETVSRKVLKIWDDEGYETIRPEEVTVHLLCDGEVYDTQKLNEENNWRYTWEELDGGCEWDLVEEDLEDYTVTITLNGITFTVRNKYSIVSVDPPVQKRITGDTPATTSPFTFVFAASDPNNPMPPGSLGSTKEIMILGAGSKEIGEIVFEKPGTYVYTVREKAGDVEGYTYDSTVYIITFEVTEEDGELTLKRTVRTDAGVESNEIVFTNPYKTPENKVPNTGVLWWPVPVLLFVGFSFVMIGLVRRRRSVG